MHLLQKHACKINFSHITHFFLCWFSWFWSVSLATWQLLGHMGAILLGKYTVLLVWVCILQIILHYFLQKTFVCKNGVLETIPMPHLFCNLIDTLPTSHYLMKLMQKNIMMSAAKFWVSLFYISTQNVAWLSEDADGMLCSTLQKIIPLSLNC